MDHSQAAGHESQAVGSSHRANLFAAVTGHGHVNMAGRDVNVYYSTSSSIEHMADLLALAVQAEWERTAASRRLWNPEPISLNWKCWNHAGSGTSARPSRSDAKARFDPLPGYEAVDEGSVAEGDESTLHNIYGGSGTGRLFILGAPGAGKSVAANLLLLNALQFRKKAAPIQRFQIPVPVMFTMHGWDPNCEAAADWVIRKIMQSYTVFRGVRGFTQAQELVLNGHIAVFLDGLDEVPSAIRAAVVTALVAAPFRIVVTSRIDDSLTATQRFGAAGVVSIEIESVSSAEAIKYLTLNLPHPLPAPWSRVVRYLEGSGSLDSPAIQDVPEVAFSSPLTLSLIRDTYGPNERVDELLDTTRFPSATSIRYHLLSNAVAVAYSQRIGEPPPQYSPRLARRTLQFIAARMASSGTHDLPWWNVSQFTRVPFLATMLLVATAFAFARYAQTGRYVDALVVGGITLLAFLARRPRTRPDGPRAIGVFKPETGLRRLRMQKAREIVGYSSASGGLMVLAGLTSGQSAGLAIGFSVILGGGIWAALYSIGLTISFRRKLKLYSQGPMSSWRSDRTDGALTVSSVGLLVSVPISMARGVFMGVTAGLLVGVCVAALSKRGTSVVMVSISGLALACTKRTPARLMTFLEDAHRRGLLLAVGPTYQFRHVDLRDQLAMNVADRRTVLRISAFWDTTKGWLRFVLRRPNGPSPRVGGDPSAVSLSADVGENSEGQTHRSSDPVDTTALMFSQAQEFERQGALEEAQSIYEHLLDVGVPKAAKHLGLLLLRLGKPEQAIEAYEKAARSGDVETMFTLAHQLDCLRREGDAEEWYRRAAGHGSGDAMFNLGNLLLNSNRLDEAEDWFCKAVDQGHPSAIYNLVTLLENDGRHPEANSLRQHLVESGDFEQIERVVGLLERAGKVDKAKDWARLIERRGFPRIREVNCRPSVVIARTSGQRGVDVEAEIAVTISELATSAIIRVNLTILQNSGSQATTTLLIRLPQDAVHGDRIRLVGRGGNGEPPGDLYLMLRPRQE